jgi:hypothetical protein
MIISNLDHLEIVREDNSIEGGSAYADARGYVYADADGRYYSRTYAYLNVYTDTDSRYYYRDSSYSSVSGSASSYSY